MVDEINIHFRVDDSSSQLKVNYDSAGVVTVNLTPGIYTSAADLATQLQTQLQATVHAELLFTYTNTAPGKFTFSSSDDSKTIAITWTHATLRDWLGFSGNVSNDPGASQPNIDSTEDLPGVFVSPFPFETLGYGWRWHTKRWEGARQTGGSIKIGKVALWNVRARLTREELSQFRSVASYLLQGVPAKWYRNQADSAAWSYSNWDGFVHVALDASQASYSDQWLNSDGILLEYGARLSFMVAA